MSNNWIDPDACKYLAVLVESVTAPLLIQHESPVCLELDIPTDLTIPAEPKQTAELIRKLVVQSLAEMGGAGDLLITACETPNGIELELADSGCDVNARAKSRPMVAAAIGASLDWQNCPQGGAAVTITFQREGESGRMAA